MGSQRRTLRYKLMDKCLLEWGPGKHGGGEDPSKPHAVRQACTQAGGASPHGPTNSCQLLSGLFPGGGRGVWGRDGLPGASGRTQAEEIGQRERPQAKGPSCWQLAARAPRQLQQWELRVC